MASLQETKEDIFSHVPQSLLDKVAQHAPLKSVQAVARLYLDEHGMYLDGYLVLTDEALGGFRQTGGAWQGDWTALKGLGSAVIVEGLGMNLLRLLSDGESRAEYRFTLRHAREVAKLHRRLEARIAGKDEAETAFNGRGEDEKKTRCEKCGGVIPAWAEVCPACLSKRKVLSRLLDFVKPYWWQAALGLVLAVAATAAGLVQPWLTKPMLDDGLGLKHGTKPSFAVLGTYILVMTALMVFIALAGFVRERMMAKLGSRMSRDIRDRTYAHLHKLSLSYFSRRPTGSLVTRVTSDSDRIWDFVAWTVVESVVSVMTIVGVGVMLFLMSWKLACVVLLPIPVMFVLMIVFHKKLHAGFDRLWHRWSVLTAVVADALPGVRVIKAFSQEKREVDRFSRKNDDYYRDDVSMISLWTLFGPVMQFGSQLGALLVWLVGGYWAVSDALAGRTEGAMTAGTLMAFMGFMWMFYGPIHNIAHMDRMFNRAATSVQRIFEILDAQPAIFSKTSAHAVQSLRGEIELSDVSFSYDGVRRVLKDVNLHIAPGEMIGLAGPSGGGKTTMVNLICRFYDVLEGRILIDGVDLRDYDIEAMRRQIGVVLQEPFLFYGTVAANIAYGKPDASLEEIITASRAANAHDFIVGFPDGYDTMVGERGHTLSGGERQRISIARAILNNPKILILDEATSSVDTETEKLIQEALDRLIANRTTIAIAHRLSTLRKASRLIILDKGQIVEQGTHEELTSKEGGVYAKLTRMQAELKSIIAIGG